MRLVVFGTLLVQMDVAFAKNVQFFFCFGGRCNTRESNFVMECRCIYLLHSKSMFSGTAHGSYSVAVICEVA